MVAKIAFKNWCLSLYIFGLTVYSICLTYHILVWPEPLSIIVRMPKESHYAMHWFIYSNRCPPIIAGQDNPTSETSMTITGCLPIIQRKLLSDSGLITTSQCVSETRVRYIGYPWQQIELQKCRSMKLGWSACLSWNYWLSNYAKLDHTQL